MKQFEVPIIYRSPLITAIKKKRKEEDRLKRPVSSGGRDLAPTLLDFGALQVFLPRYFGFCYGVENAIEIAFRTIEESRKSGAGNTIYLLSEMIHNPQVNADLQANGIRFLQDTHGNTLIPFDKLKPGDIVLIPAFGTTLEIEKKLKNSGIRVERYNTTCPFVEKVWNRSASIAEQNYTVIIHGKPKHEETRATFSHASAGGPAVIVKDMQQAKELAKYIRGEKNASQFYHEFEGQYSSQFDAVKHLRRIGVVNQTTMLASDTQAIADFLKQTMIDHYHLSRGNAEEHFADTRDTLCYATNDNQTAVISMLKTKADLAIVVGGYNSSNTSHLVELCEAKLPTYFISDEEKILSSRNILHYNFHSKEELLTENFLPDKQPVKILVTSGASCPDAIVEAAIKKIVSFYPSAKNMDRLTGEFS